MDIDENCSLNATTLEERIKKFSVEAFLVSHYFGFSSNILEVVCLCDKYEVKLVEDCAHSFLKKLMINQ